MLIEPYLEGHTETAIVGREGEIARLLGISVHIVRERVRALLRRDEVGRTGVFIAKEVAPNETFELILKKLSDQNPAVRRRIQFSEK
jgi:predicted nucleotidyltransferase